MNAKYLGIALILAGVGLLAFGKISLGIALMVGGGIAFRKAREGF